MTEVAHDYRLRILSTPLSEDEQDDAELRGKDLGWSALISVYEKLRASKKLNYSTLGARIGRSGKQVQRWMSSPVNMTFRSFSLIAEGMDADIEILVLPRTDAASGHNEFHPSDASTWERDLLDDAINANIKVQKLPLELNDSTRYKPKIPSMSNLHKLEYELN